MSKVYLAYDERMTLHKPLPSTDSDTSSSDDDQDEIQVENPTRIHAMYEKLIRLESIDGYRRFLEIPCIPAARNTIELMHSPEHFDRMAITMAMTDDELRNMGVPNDLYYCKDTFTAARLACGGVVECVNAVTENNRRSNRAIAIVRPPGHHATRDEAMGKSTFVRPFTNPLNRDILTIIVSLSLFQDSAISTMWQWQPSTPLLQNERIVSLFSIGTFIMAMAFKT